MINKEYDATHFLSPMPLAISIGLGNVNYKQIAEKVFLITDAKKHMKELGQKTPDGAYPMFTIMGKEFDAAKAEQYAAGFATNKIG